MKHSTLNKSGTLILSVGWLIVCGITALSAQTGYIVPQKYEIFCVGPGTRKTHNKTMKQYTKPKKS